MTKLFEIKDYDFINSSILLRSGYVYSIKAIVGHMRLPYLRATVLTQTLNKYSNLW